jgi:hypothetical protein
MKQILEKWARPIEVVAIVLGGTFAFITWGGDQLSIRQPNRDVEVDSVNEAVLEYENNVGCSWEGLVKIDNKGTRPLSAESTLLEFYTFPRPKVDGVAENTGYSFEMQICKKSSPDKSCVNPFHSTQIEQLDNSLIFPGKQVWRPFSIIFGSHGSLEEMQNDLIDKVMLVRVTQNLVVESQYGWSKKEVARVNVLDPHICSFSLKFPESHNKSMQPIAKASAGLRRYAYQ